MFQKLLQTIPFLQDRLMTSEGPAELMVIAELVSFAWLIILNHSHILPKIQKGISSARSDDTKGLKGVVLDWILPRDGDTRNLLPMQPPKPLTRNVKTNRGFHHPVTGALLCPAGLNYQDAEQVP